jgi:hypothetical protein
MLTPERPAGMPLTAQRSVAAPVDASTPRQAQTATHDTLVARNRALHVTNLVLTHDHGGRGSLLEQ